ncbi:MAG: ABC transporter substrate-binding protein [Planctomycetota bacterium]|jgi:ABC-type Fe3+-hydroxamate transport system substrate-binding protein
MTAPRVVSLLPSATELLDFVGGSEFLVGRSHECDFPARVADRPVLTGQRTRATTSADIDRQVRASLASDEGGSGLYTLDVEALVALQPDVILTQDLCDVCSIDLQAVRGAAARIQPTPEIVSLDPTTIEDVFDDVLAVGRAVGRAEAAQRAIVRLRADYWTAVDNTTPYTDGPCVAFLEWMDPLFVGGHWTPQLIVAAGGRHPLNAAGARSRQATPEELVDSSPDRLIVCPCGYDLAAIERELPALQAQPWWESLPAVRDGHVALVDGSQMFNRPGPRLVEAFRWLVAWLNDRPEVAPAGFPARLLPAAGG